MVPLNPWAHICRCGMAHHVPEAQLDHRTRQVYSNMGRI